MRGLARGTPGGRPGSIDDPADSRATTALAHRSRVHPPRSSWTRNARTGGGPRGGGRESASGSAVNATSASPATSPTRTHERQSGRPVGRPSPRPGVGAATAARETAASTTLPTTWIHGRWRVGAAEAAARRRAHHRAPGGRRARTRGRGVRWRRRCTGPPTASAADTDRTTSTEAPRPAATPVGGPGRPSAARRSEVGARGGPAWRPRPRPAAPRRTRAERSRPPLTTDATVTNMAGERPDFYSLIAQNRRRTWLLMFCLLPAPRASWASPSPCPVGWGPGRGDRDRRRALGHAHVHVVLPVRHARPCGPPGRSRPTRVEFSRLHNLVQEVSIAAGIPPPRVYVVHDPAPNAFATGRNEEKAAVAVTTGLTRQDEPRRARGRRWPMSWPTSATTTSS